MNKYIIACIALLTALASCSPGTPKQYLQPDELEDILYDMHLARGMVYQGEDSKQYDYNRVLYHAAVLKKHGVTQAEFDSSMVYYYKRADRLEKIYKRVAKRLEEQALSLGATEGEMNQYNQFSAGGDTANIWNGDVAAVLLPYPMHNRLEFDIKADSSFRKGDTFLLNIMMDFHYQSGTREAEGCLLLVYDNDSVACRTNRLSFSGQNQMRLQADDEHQIKEVKGYVYLARCNEKTAMLNLLFMSNIQLIRIHKKVEKDDAGENMKTDSVAYGQDADLRSDSTAAPDVSQPRFGRALPPGGRKLPLQEKAVEPTKDIKLKIE